MKKQNVKLTIACAISTLAACQMANANITVDTTHVNATGGTQLETFNSGYVAGVDNNGLTVTITPDGGLVTGSVGSINAAPYDPALAATDTTQYLTTGKDPGMITFAFDTTQNYLGLLWGSVDTFNTLSFYDGSNNLLGSLSGLDVLPPATGSQGPGGSAYVNITTSFDFSKVVATSSNYAFEIDNLAYSDVTIGQHSTPVPEPSTVVAGALLLLPFGVSTLRIMRKNKMQ